MTIRARVDSELNMAFLGLKQMYKSNELINATLFIIHDKKIKVPQTSQRTNTDVLCVTFDNSYVEFIERLRIDHSDRQILELILTTMLKHVDELPKIIENHRKKKSERPSIRVRLYDLTENEYALFESFCKNKGSRAQEEIVRYIKSCL